MKEVKKLDLRETKIPCEGCRKEMEVWEIYYDDASGQCVCRICSCHYATLAHQPFEMRQD